MKKSFLKLAVGIVAVTALCEKSFALQWQDCVQYDLASLDRIERLALAKDNVLLKKFKPNEKKTPFNTINLATPLFHNDEEQLAKAGQYYGSSRFLSRYRAMQKASSCDALAAEFGTSYSISLMTVRSESCFGFDLERGLKPYKTTCDHQTTKNSSAKNKDEFFKEVLELTGRLKSEIQNYKAYQIPDDADSIMKKPLKFLPKDCVAADLQVLADLEARALAKDRTLTERFYSSQYDPQHHYILIAAKLQSQFEYDKKYYRDTSFEIMTSFQSCDEYRKWLIEHNANLEATNLLPAAKYHPIERNENVNEEKMFKSILERISELRARLPRG